MEKAVFWKISRCSNNGVLRWNPADPLKRKQKKAPHPSKEAGLLFIRRITVATYPFTIIPPITIQE